MEDLFKFEEDKNSLRQTNNGLASARKANYKSEIKRTNRDLSFEEIINEIGGMPKPNEIISIKTNGCSDTGSIFRNIIKNRNCDTLYLATWIISKENIDTICSALDDGRLNKIVFVCSTRMDELKKAHANHLKEEFLKRKNKCFFKICNSHAKTFSISDFNGNYYTVTGSGNWTENQRIENYLILNNKDIFLHNKEWMEDLVYGSK